MLTIAATCYIGNVTTGYWSYVDRLWSITPWVYAIIVAAYNPANARVAIMALLATLWGIRLTFNFARKGGYGAEEDYRWPILRAWFKAHDPTHPLGRELFSILFVAQYQHALIWALAVPAAWAAAAYSPRGTLGLADLGLVAAFLAFLAGETWTDETQWAFQSAKHALTPAARAAAGGDTARGFCTSGPFKYSRHLNFFCEQCIWWVFYGFTVAAGGPVLNFTILGPFLLTLLFLGSTRMTESLSAAKYPAYAAYQQTTSALVPWLPGVSLDSAEGQKLVAAATASSGGKKGGAAAAAAAPASAAGGKKEEAKKAAAAEAPATPARGRSASPARSARRR
jgi:steroid 5-alpha reductase family enzyme